MKRIYNAPCGNLLVEVRDGLVVRCGWLSCGAEAEGAFHAVDIGEGAKGRLCDAGDAALMERTLRELSEYFSGKRRIFTVPVSLARTPFSRRVLLQLMKIPYGKVMTYAEVAEAIRCPGGQRAVAQACSRNRVAVIVPCHRVVSAGGRMGGYTISGIEKKRGSTPGGMAIKQYLLSVEASGASLFK